MKPLVSIIIPVYNRAKEFERSLISAADQNYPNIEVIVVNDGSSEDILSVVDKIRSISPFPIIYHSQSNKGIGAARKSGLELSSGKYIQHLDWLYC